jgi:hypothetical protein
MGSLERSVSAGGVTIAGDGADAVGAAAGGAAGSGGGVLEQAAKRAIANEPSLFILKITPPFYAKSRLAR